MSEREAMTLKLVAYHNEQARGASFEWHARCATHIENQEQAIKALVDALVELRELMEAVRAGEYKPDSFTVQSADAALRLAGRLP